MTWKCTNCGVDLENMDIVVIGPGTLKWCVKCQEKARQKANDLSNIFERGDFTIHEVLEARAYRQQNKRFTTMTTSFEVCRNPASKREK